MTEMDELAVRDEVDRSNCFARAMERWHASRKRPDLTDEERVRGALQAYERQAFANELRRSSLSPAGVTDTEARAFAVAYEKSCNHRYDMGAIRAGLEAAAKAQPSISTGQGEPNEEVWIERSRANAEAFAAAEEEFFQELAKQPASEQGEPVAWHWWASDKSSTWPVWSLGPERPANAPGAIPLYARPSLPAGHVAVPVEAMVLLEEILNEDAPNKYVWKTHETMDDWLKDKILPLLRTIRAVLPHNQGEGK